MPELDDVIAEALEERARSLADVRPSPRAAAAVSAHVRGRRVRRRALQATLALPVVAILAVGGWALADRAPGPVPPATEHPRPTPTASSEPTQSPTADDAARVALPAEDGLPPRFAAPQGLLAGTGPGWVLATYARVPTDPASAPADTVLVLADPEGTAYELARLPVEHQGGESGWWTVYRLLDWRAGSSSALVATGRGSYLGSDGGPWSYAMLDLTTGVLGDPLPGHDGLDFVGAVGDTWYWWGGGQWFTERLGGVLQGVDGATDPGYLSPDGRYVVTGSAVVELSGGAQVLDLSETSDGAYCEPVAWWGPASILATCADPRPAGFTGGYLELHPRLVAFDLGEASPAQGALVRALEAGDPVPHGWGTWVTDREVVVPGTTLTKDSDAFGGSCADGVFLLRDGTVSAVSLGDSRASLGTFRVTAGGGRVVVQSHPGCWNAPGDPSVLSAVDLESGTATSVLPLPVPTPGSSETFSDPSGWTPGR